MIVDQETISDQWIQNHCKIIDVQTFRDNNSEYDRVLYHFGNSQFHDYMFALLLEIPGVAILHDLYLSGINHHDDNDLTSACANNQIISDYARGIIMHSENSSRQYVQEIERHYTKKIAKKEEFSELRARVSEAESKVSKAEAKMTEAEAMMDEARDHYSRLYNSFSYRVTKPLRTARGFMKKGTK